MRLLPLVALAFSAAPLAVTLALTVPADRGRYGSVFDERGLPALAVMHSVLAAEVWVVVTPVALGPIGFCLGCNYAGYRTLRDLLQVTLVTPVGAVLYTGGVYGVSTCAGLGGPAAALLFLAALVIPGVGSVAFAWIHLLGSYLELSASPSGSRSSVASRGEPDVELPAAAVVGTARGLRFWCSRGRLPDD